MSKVLVCGMGNAAHVFIGLLSSCGVEVRVFESLGQAHVEKFQRGLASNDGNVTVKLLDGTVRKGAPAVVTCDPEVALDGFTDRDVVLMPVPSFAIPNIVNKLVPHLPVKAMVGAMPGQGGLDWEIARILSTSGRTDVVVFGTNTLPFACRIEEFGAVVNCPGVKRELQLATSPASKSEQVSELLNHVFEPASVRLDANADPFSLRFVAFPNFLCLALQPLNQAVHPTIMRSLCGKKDNYDAPPEFYWSLDEATAGEISAIEAEFMSLAEKLDEIQPLLKVRPHVLDIRTFLVNAYSDSIAEEDKAEMITCFNKNKVYKGMTAPVVADPKDPTKFIPNLKSRYLTEDVPDSLMLFRGIAELCGVATPNVDHLLLWAQASMGVEYLVQSETGDVKFTGKDIPTTRAPQNYGIQTKEDLVGFYMT